MKKLALIVFAILFLFNCTRDIREYSIIYLYPTEADIPGWAIEDEPEKIEPQLFLNDEFLLREFNISEVAEAKFYSLANETKIKINIINCKNEISAFAFMTRINENQLYLDDTITRNFYLNINKCYLIRDKYLISFEFSNDENLFKAATLFSITFDNKIPRKNFKIPKSAFVFSSDRKIIDFKFYKNENLKYTPVKNAYVRKYRDNQIFYKKLKNKKTAIKEYYNYITNNKEFIIIESDKYKSAFLKNNGKYFFIAYYKKWIFGTYSTDSIKSGKNLILSLLKKLK